MNLPFNIDKDIHSSRSKDAVKNIILSFGAKGVSVVISLLLVPMTINYVNPTQYGIWMTLSQIIGWVVFFDLGLGNGFRNRYAQAKANGDMKLAREYLSTTYFSITCLVLLMFIIMILANSFIDWSKVLRLDSVYRNELKRVFGIVSAFFCLNMIANVFSMLLSADQKPGYASVIVGIGQIVSLIVIIILTRYTDGSLINLAIFYSGIPCIVMLAASIFAFRHTRLKEVCPRIIYIRTDLIKDILGLGIKFFIICVSMIAIFQVTNMIIAREVGPESVTQYNIVYKYFNVLYTLMILIITPFWSAFTDAYVKKDREWMGRTLKTLEKVWMVAVIAGILMLLISPLFYKIWIGDKVIIPFYLSVGLMIFVLIQSLANIYMYIINGIGTIRIQLMTYLIFAVFAWPVLTFCCREFGVIGIVIIPSLTYFAQAIISKAQIGKILTDRANGWWGK